MAHYRILALPIQLSHVLHVANLPPLHQDPFDRLLVAQCQVENILLLSADAEIAQYAITIIG